MPLRWPKACLQANALWVGGRCAGAPCLLLGLHPGKLSGGVARCQGSHRHAQRIARHPCHHLHALGTLSIYIKHDATHMLDFHVHMQVGTGPLRWTSASPARPAPTALPVPPAAYHAPLAGSRLRVPPSAPHALLAPTPMSLASPAWCALTRAPRCFPALSLSVSAALRR